MTGLTAYQRLILALLEEAGEQELATLMNTVRKRFDSDNELNAMRAALIGLIDWNLLEIATARDTTSLCWTALKKEEGLELLQNLQSLLSWSAYDQSWRSAKERPETVVLLTDAGFSESRKVLSEEGYPLGKDGKPL